MSERDDLVERLGFHQEHPVTGKLVLRNPDGPDAADRLVAMREALERARAWVDDAVNGVTYFGDVAAAMAEARKNDLAKIDAALTSPPSSK